MAKNADFILLKLNNRLVDHQVNRNSTFLLGFWKVHGILSLEQSTVSGAERCALIAAVPKTACNFSTKNTLHYYAETFILRVILSEESIAIIKNSLRYPQGGQN